MRSKLLLLAAAAVLSSASSEELRSIDSAPPPPRQPTPAGQRLALKDRGSNHKYKPHQGQREMARRRRQLQRQEV